MECYDGSDANAEASSTHPTPCSSLRKGGYIMLKGQPCKIVELLTSTPGKHGHSKVIHEHATIPPKSDFICIHVC